MCLSVCLCALADELFDFSPSFWAWRLTLTLARVELKVKVIGLILRSRSNMKIVFLNVGGLKKIGILLTKIIAYNLKMYI